MKAQELVQCMVPRALFGGVRNTSKSVYSWDSQLLLSRPSVSGADLKNKYSGISSTVSSTWQLFLYRYQPYYLQYVVDSHIQRVVLATEETTATQQVSHRPIKCQYRLWSQRGTKVTGSHHGDNPLLRPTGIQIATKSYAALQAMAPTNIKTVHQTSLLHIESNLDRLGMLSPTHDQRSQQKHGKIRSNQF